MICVPLTSNLRWAEAPGNLLLRGRITGLSADSVANVSQIVTLDRSGLSECVGKPPPTQVKLVLSGIEVALGR